MEEILFRAKGIEEYDKDRWYYGYYYCTHDTTHCGTDCTPEETHHYILFEEMNDWELPNKLLRVEIDVNTLGQYIGIKDKNGTKMFEGDICEYNDYIGMIKFDEQDSMFTFTYDGNIMTDFSCLWGKELEVVGNVQDNPELLEEDN
ncbi:MAG: YopX family protein [Candidatus Gastranaerophilaceae bacterium]